MFSERYHLSTVRKFTPVTIAPIKMKIAQIVGEEEIAWAKNLERMQIIIVDGPEERNENDEKGESKMETDEKDAINMKLMSTNQLIFHHHHQILNHFFTIKIKSKQV